MITKHPYKKSGKKGYSPFVNIHLGNASGIFAESQDKHLLKGRFSLNRTRQPEYGEQIILQVFTQDPPTSKRRFSNAWNRIEIYYPFSEIDKLIAALIEITDMEETTNDG